jgi:hypothetical protein
MLQCKNIDLGNKGFRHGDENARMTMPGKPGILADA